MIVLFWPPFFWSHMIGILVFGFLQSQNKGVPRCMVAESLVLGPRSVIPKASFERFKVVI